MTDALDFISTSKAAVDAFDKIKFSEVLANGVIRMFKDCCQCPRDDPKRWCSMCMKKNIQYMISRNTLPGLHLEDFKAKAHEIVGDNGYQEFINDMERKMFSLASAKVDQVMTAEFMIRMDVDGSEFARTTLR